MIPITKNIRVMDEQGNQYEATYPKRAKGLVKQGRARFIDNQTICLLEEPRPPKINHKILEDDKMNTEHENRTNGPRPGATVPATPPVPPTPPLPPPVPGMQKELLDRLDTIINNTDYLKETVNTIRDMAGSGEIDNHAIADAYVEGLCDIITKREATNQKAIELIRDMYESEKSGKSGFSSVSGASIAQNAIALGLDLNELIEHMPPEQALRFTRELLGMGV
ncbi:MAG: hypothetical protein FWC71_03020 [Defluviitaleaceae bacterium]|nr:hypothetical protein [Defluviitaleaceae bacterium]